MSPRKGPKKSEALSVETAHTITERTALLIERIQATLVNALTRLQKERYELKEFAYKHFRHVSPEPTPKEEDTQLTSINNKREIRK